MRHQILESSCVMGRKHKVRAGLRSATSEAHARVDAVFSRFDLAEREGYTRFLQAQAAATLPLEHALERGAVSQLSLDWPARRRGAALLADLAALGARVPGSEELSPIEGRAAALGTLYVLEGSRLGGIMLKQSVPAEFPSAFFAPGPVGGWRALLETLETSLLTPELQEEAIAAAQHAFLRFEECGLACALRTA